MPCTIDHSVLAELKLRHCLASQLGEFRILTAGDPQHGARNFTETFGKVLLHAEAPCRVREGDGAPSLLEKMTIWSGGVVEDSLGIPLGQEMLPIAIQALGRPKGIGLEAQAPFLCRFESGMGSD